MVKILANGDIVPDDDPRVKQASRRSAANPTRQGGFQSAGDNRDDQGPVQQINIFQSLNQRLLAFGIPQLRLGDIVVEPIVLVGFILVLMIFGIHGLIFGVLLYTVSRWSQYGAPDFVKRLFGGNENQHRDENRNNRGLGRAGGGYRLGR
ncbi:unnamed protein product [Lymnaea stagnalis]|uniref:DUF4605 domain-containing protein n=1 Tax=Lymnaea stagnalis TaxID=6523 RepID=A0AAV2I6A6_LYMST